jgi:transketolase
MLNERSKQVRRDTIALSKANGGYHYGGSFSCTEILISLFDHVMGPDDKVILSKGHACWPLYVLLREQGLNPKLGGHPERDPANGIWATTGSLGHGLPTAVGMALAKKLRKDPARLFVIMGDGECQAGTLWESMLIARQLNLNNLVVIVDWNGIQGSDFCSKVLDVTAVKELGLAAIVGWEGVQVDGHDMAELSDALLQKYPEPTMVIALTIKGKGVSFMENVPKWHACWLNPGDLAQALGELEC